MKKIIASMVLFIAVMAQVVYVGNPVRIGDLGTNALYLNKYGEISSTTRDEERILTGDFFTASHYYSAVANDGVANFAILITNYNLRPNVYVVSEGKAVYRMIEYSGWPTNALVAPHVKTRVNRQNANMPLAVVSSAPIFTNASELIEIKLIPGGTGVNSEGATAENQIEWLMKTNTWYCVCISNVSGAAQDISVKLYWHREIP